MSDLISRQDAIAIMLKYFSSKKIDRGDKDV